MTNTTQLAEAAEGAAARDPFPSGLLYMAFFYPSSPGTVTLTQGLTTITGVADPFDSEDGAAGAASENESYDSENDLYSPSELLLGTTAMSTSLNSDSSQGARTHRNWISAAAISAGGNFVRVRLRGATVGVPKPLNNVFIAQNSGAASPDADATPVRLTFSGSNSVSVPTGSFVWSDWVEYTLDAAKNVLVNYDFTSNGGTERMRYEAAPGANFNLYLKDSVQESGLQTVSGYTASGQFWVVDAIEVKDFALNNMTLVSTEYTADAEPDTARLAVQLVENESITINTDLTGEVSRDGGSTWTAATLVYKSSNGGAKLYEDQEIDISGQPSGTSMKWRVKTLNNKDVDVSGVVLQWV